MKQHGEFVIKLAGQNPVLQELRRTYQEGNLILFVGAGLSINLGLPTWGQVVDEIAVRLGYDVETFRSYGNHLSLIEYYCQREGVDALRRWMHYEWHRSDVDIRASRPHTIIAENNFPIIYTTNYDGWLEEAFRVRDRSFVKVLNVSDMRRIAPGCVQIIKFHGDFEDRDSMVLGESSYFDRLSFESPLDIKLRADVLGKSVLFIGYSLTDINIRLLFYKLSQLWDADAGAGAQPMSYFFSLRENPVESAILYRRGITMLAAGDSGDDPGQALTEFLEALTG